MCTDSCGYNAVTSNLPSWAINRFVLVDHPTFYGYPWKNMSQQISYSCGECIEVTGKSPKSWISRTQHLFV